MHEYANDSELYDTTGEDLSSHVTGNPIGKGPSQAQPSVGHTLVIVVGALALLWVLAYVFKSVRI